MQEFLPHFQSFEQDRADVTDASTVRRDDIAGENDGGASGPSDLRAVRSELDLNAAAPRRVLLCPSPDPVKSGSYEGYVPLIGLAETEAVETRPRPAPARFIRAMTSPLVNIPTGRR